MNNLPCFYSGLYDYQGFQIGASHCHLHLFGDVNTYVVAVASEVGSNPGASITDRAEHLATQVVHTFALEPGRVTWIEHYPWSADAWTRAKLQGHNPWEIMQPDVPGAETFDQVIFGPWPYERRASDSLGKVVHWRSLSKDALTAWLGAPLPPSLLTLVGH